MQATPGPADLGLVLALVRSGSLAGAADRLAVDPSTVFRSIQRLERVLGHRLFERSRSGWHPTDLALTLVAPAEAVEGALESARAAMEQGAAAVSGTVRITTTDTVLHGLLAPTWPGLRTRHPGLEIELRVGNEPVSLVKRDADIALRATRRPPAHLVGRSLGAIEVVPCVARRRRAWDWNAVEQGAVPWIAPDDGLPAHPTVVWRRRRFPRVVPAVRVDSVLSVAALVAQGLGVGLLPRFLLGSMNDLKAIGAPVAECTTELWLLTHPDVRHLRRIAAVWSWLAENVVPDRTHASGGRVAAATSTRRSPA